MNITTRTCAVAAALLTLASPAFALTITNSDSAQHTVRITNGDDDDNYTIASGETAKDKCENDCDLRLDGSEEIFSAREGDALTIKDGAFVK